MAKAKTKQQLTIENEELRARLQEMEDTLEAIRSGAVDAIVTSGPAGDQVYTLEGADHAYHTMVESMNEGAVTVLADGTILYANRQFGQLTGASPSEIIGRRFHDFVSVSDYPILDAILDKEGLDCPRAEIRLGNDPDADMPVQIAASLIELGGAKALTLVITDLSAQRRYEEIVAAEKLSRRILEQAQEAIAVCINGCIVRANRAFYEICGRFPLMQPFDLVFPLRMSDSGMFSIAMPDTGKTIQNREVRYQRPDGKIFDLVLNAGPLVGKEHKVLGSLISLQDITARKRQAALLDGIGRIFKEAISSQSEEQLGEICLAVAGELTASPIGFIGEIGADGKLYDITISNPGWDACRIPERTGHRGSHEFKIHGLYGRVLREGKSFFTNDPSSEPDSIGLPPGHPPLASFLGVPLLRAGRAIGLVAVGNREGGYGQEELDALAALAPSIVEAQLRKRAEEALREASQKAERNQLILESMLHQMPVGVILTDASGMVAKNNAAMDRIWKREMLPHENVESHHYVAYHKDGKEYRPEEWPLTRALRNAEDIVGEEMVILRGDGTKGTVLVSSSPIQDTSGQIIAGVVVDVDITDRKLAEDKLREAEERFRLAVSAAHAMVYDLDLRTLRVRDMPGLHDLLGYDKASVELTLEWWDHQIHPEDLEICHDAYQRMRTDPQDHMLEYRIRHKDGHILWVEDHAVPVLDDNGQVVRIVGTVVDITDRKQAEMALKEANESLEQRVRERTMDLQNLMAQLELSRHELRRLASELVMAEERERKRVAGVLHDEIAQTLAAARMRVDMVQGIPSDQEERIKEAKALLAQSIRETRSLMNDLGNPLLFDMGLQAACESLAERLMRIHPVRIRCDIRDAYKCLDPDIKIILYQLIRELLNNIVKHSQAQNAHVAIDTENGIFRVKVTDDGMGFDPETLGAPTTEGGFGLYSIRERLIAVDGTLRIESAPGAGTTVTATVPATMR